MENIQELEELLELIEGEEVLLAYFGSSKCSVCVDLKPKVIELLKKYEKIKSVYIDVDKYPKIAVKYGFFTVPGIILFIEGRETLREARLISIPDLDDKIGRYCQLLKED